MALTQQDILALKEILKPQFDALGLQMADLKETISANAEAHRVENERRRDDVGNLYEKDRVRTAEHSELVARVVALEEWRHGHSKLDDAREDGKKFTTSQRWVAAGVVVTIAVFLLDKISDFFMKMGGK